MKLNHVRISAFRGINERINLEPNGNSLLLIGDNGMGKTSILQAIEWGLLGELAFLEGDEFRREDALVNLFDKEGIAVVDMGIQGEKGEILQVVRERKRMSKTKGKSSITLKVDGAVCKGGNAEIKLREVLKISPEEYNTTVHLHQEVVRELVEGNEESRNKAINKILGIDLLSDFGEIITKQVHSSSMANRSLRGMQNFVQELGIERKTTSDTRTEEVKTFEKIKTKLADRDVDVRQPNKTIDTLVSGTSRAMNEMAEDLELRELTKRISSLQIKKEKERIEENLDEIIEIKRELRSTVQDVITKAKNQIVECDLMEKQRKTHLERLAKLKIDRQAKIESEVKDLEVKVAQLGKELSDLQTKENQITELENDIRLVLDRLDKTSKEIESITSKYGDESIIQEKQNTLDKQETDLKQELERLGAYNNILDSAIRYLAATEAKTCPVCDRPIQYKDILSSIRKKISEEIGKRMKETNQLLEEAKTAKDQLKTTSRELEQLRKDIDGYRTKLDQTKKDYQQLTEFELSEPFLPSIEEYVRRLRKQIDERKKSAEDMRTRINELKTAASILEDIDTVESKLNALLNFSGSSKELPAALQNYLETKKVELEELQQKSERIDELNKNLDILEDIATFLRRSASLAALEKSLEEIDQKLSHEQDKLSKMNALVEALTDIQEAVNSAKMESLENILSTIHGDFNAYYSRLIGHPLFVRLKLVPEEKGGTHVYRITAESKNGEYTTFVRTRFSQAQRNVVAISLFLAIARHSPARIVILDDPSQSLDEEHKKSFGEILRSLVKEMNVVVATQDEDFANQILKQIPSKQLKAYKLTEWNQNGPSIKEMQSPS